MTLHLTKGQMCSLQLLDMAQPLLTARLWLLSTVNNQATVPLVLENLRMNNFQWHCAVILVSFPGITEPAEGLVSLVAGIFSHLAVSKYEQKLGPGLTF